MFNSCKVQGHQLKWCQFTTAFVWWIQEKSLSVMKMWTDWSGIDTDCPVAVQRSRHSREWSCRGSPSGDTFRSDRGIRTGGTGQSGIEGGPRHWSPHSHRNDRMSAPPGCSCHSCTGTRTFHKLKTHPLTRTSSGKLMPILMHQVNR